MNQVLFETFYGIKPVNRNASLISTAYFSVSSLLLSIASAIIKRITLSIWCVFPEYRKASDTSKIMANKTISQSHPDNDNSNSHTHTFRNRTQKLNDDAVRLINELNSIKAGSTFAQWSRSSSRILEIQTIQTGTYVEGANCQFNRKRNQETVTPVSGSNIELIIPKHGDVFARWSIRIIQWLRNVCGSTVSWAWQNCGKISVSSEWIVHILHDNSFKETQNESILETRVGNKNSHNGATFEYKTNQKARKSKSFIEGKTEFIPRWLSIDGYDVEAHVLKSALLNHIKTKLNPMVYYFDIDNFRSIIFQSNPQFSKNEKKYLSSYNGALVLGPPSAQRQQRSIYVSKEKKLARVKVAFLMLLQECRFGNCPELLKKNQTSPSHFFSTIFIFRPSLPS